MKFTIFYSWQSDIPEPVNKSAIQNALEASIATLRENNAIDIDPCLDRDTAGVTGTPGIADTILSKIEKAGLVVADVTIVTPKCVHRPAPNPNVLLELGYAAARLGWERIVCVMNEHFGGPTKLPFDLRHRRWPIRYRLSPDASAESVAQECERLTQAFELAVRQPLESGLLTAVVNPKDRRVAERYEHILNTVSALFAGFSSAHGIENVSHVFTETHADAPGTKYPEKTLADEIVAMLQGNDLKVASTTRVDGNPITWAEELVRTFATAVQECDRLLDRYADRDDALIGMVEEVRNRLNTLAQAIIVTASAPELAGLYDKGVPDVHADFYRYLVLAMIKSYRIVREFK